jgi:hypothetical protein
MSDYFQRLQMQVAALEQRMGSLVRDATVKEVKGDKFRAVIGQDDEGKDILSPWIHNSTIRGGARERRFFKEGQNIRLLNATGDYSQALVFNGPPNKKFKKPDHADDEKKEEETYQQGELRVRKTSDKGYEIWLEEEDKEEQGGQAGGAGAGGAGGQSGQSGQKKEKEPKSKLWLKPDEFHAQVGGKDGPKVTVKKNLVQGVIGKNRFVSRKEGVKMKAGSDFAVVRDGELIVSKEWVVGADPLPDED